jgi:hypothetical protein
MTGGPPLLWIFPALNDPPRLPRDRPASLPPLGPLGHHLFPYLAPWDLATPSRILGTLASSQTRERKSCATVGETLRRAAVRVVGAVQNHLQIVG